MKRPHANPKIPDHEIICKIGSGAYGEVWMAQTVTGAMRAVKVIRRDDFDDERTFQREFEAIKLYEPIARNHPGLVHILQIGTGTIPTPFYYYVMELGDDAQHGQHISPDTYTPRTLQTDKKAHPKEPLPVEYTLRIGLDLSDALAYLHEKNLTHRDIKPANVIFVNGKPKLADVGLVAVHDQRTFVGTEGFIPYEGPGTARADIYALGKVLYELNTGKDRLDFPELPDRFPPHYDRARWLALNQVLCDVCEPRLERCKVRTAKQLHHALAVIQESGIIDKHLGTKSSTIKFSTLFFSITILLGSLFTTSYFLSKNKISFLSSSSTEENLGSVIISSFPEGASVYDKEGVLLGETPLGPLPYPQESEVDFLLKLDGYKPLHERGIVKAGKTLGIGGPLDKFAPPSSSESWKDVTGLVYKAKKNQHCSISPILGESYNQYLKEAHVSNDDFRPVDSPVFLTNDEAESYERWLTNQCKINGLLADDQSIILTKAKNITSPNIGQYAYWAKACTTHYIQLTISSTPSGASVYIDQEEIGHTPLNYDKFSTNYSALTIKKPGFDSVTIPNQFGKQKKLLIDAQLTPNGSVQFGTQWKNSLNMTFLPIKAGFMASKYEVTNADYYNYLGESYTTNSETETPSPDTKRNENTLNQPITNITREEARRFAEWLTNKEHTEGILDQNDFYRLPTDEEWTMLCEGDHWEKEIGDTPNERYTNALPQINKGIPVSEIVGNVADVSAKNQTGKGIDFYNDGFPNVTSVGNFSPNDYGLCDMCGNVWEWVDDNYGGEPDFKFRDYAVARGASWATHRLSQIHPRYRLFLPSNTTLLDVGFRLVLERKPSANVEQTLESETKDSSSSPSVTEDDVYLNQ